MQLLKLSRKSKKLISKQQMKQFKPVFKSVKVIKLVVLASATL